jgi:hypothetical protein
MLFLLICLELFIVCVSFEICSTDDVENAQCCSIAVIVTCSYCEKFILPLAAGVPSVVKIRGARSSFCCRDSDFKDR